jgi:Mce-associated membrane protein
VKASTVPAGIADPVTAGKDDAAEDYPDDGETSQVADSSTKHVLRQINWSRLMVFVVLPVLAMVLAGGAGYLKWLDASEHDADTARIEAGQVAHDSTIALLSYRPDDVEQKLLGAASQLLTGQFQNSYTALLDDLVIPSARQQRIASTAAVPAVATLSASAKHVVALAFVNQIITIGNGAPTNTASSVRLTLDKVGDRWLISSFEPV